MEKLMLGLFYQDESSEGRQDETGASSGGAQRLPQRELHDEIRQEDREPSHMIKGDKLEQTEKVEHLAKRIWSKWLNRRDTMRIAEQFGYPKNRTAMPLNLTAWNGTTCQKT